LFEGFAAHRPEERQRLRTPVVPVPDLAEPACTPHWQPHWQERGSFAPVSSMPEDVGPAMPFHLRDPGTVPPPLGLPALTLRPSNQDAPSERLGLSAADYERLEREHVMGTCAATWAN
jgi:hypothetical protein